MYLFFDTETTGVPKNYKASPKDLDNWPRVIQLAFALFDKDGECIMKHCDLILPNGWEIPNEKFWIENGFSTEKSKATGIRIETSLDLFLNLMEQSEFLIAHNLNFDMPIMQAEMIRAGIKTEKKLKKFCTMISTTDICRIPHANGRGYKWPKLEELHRYLFQSDFDGAHDALNDVLATAKCFFELKKQELIVLPI